MDLLHFLLTSLIVILIPGAGMTYTVSIGLILGRKAGISAAIGCSLGILPHILISILFFSCFFQMNPFLFFLIKILGACYLLYLGITFFRKPLTFTLSMNEEEKSTFTLLRKGTLLNCFNPQLTLFFFSFLPQFTTPASPHFLMESLFYGLLFFILSLFLFIIYGVISNSIREAFSISQVLLFRVQKLLGLLFLFFSIQLAFSSL